MYRHSENSIDLQTEQEVDENANWCRKHVHLHIYTSRDTTISCETIWIHSLCSYFCREQKCLNASRKHEIG